MQITLTLAQLAVFCQRCATFQDPGFGDSPERATERALSELGVDDDAYSTGDDVQIVT